MSETSGDPVRRRAKDRKEQIFAAAAELFAQRGFAGVSVDDIGAAVGISGPALYRHFRGKREVLTAILDRTMTALAAAATGSSNSEGLAEDRAPGSDGSEALRSIIRQTTAVAMSDPAGFGVWLREGRHHDPETMGHFVELRRRSGVLWHAAERVANGSLSRAELRVREEAVVAVINALARRPTNVAPRRVAAVAAAGAMAAVLAPSLPHEPPVGQSGRVERGDVAPWAMPPSCAETILAVALPLFRVHGFAGVTMDRIGEASGITGPSLYRYYESKTAILSEAFDRADTRVAVTAEIALSAARTAREALRSLIDSYVRIALESADLVVVTTRESLSLPPEERRRQGARRRANSDSWVRVLGVLRPELDGPDVRLLVRAMFGVVNQLVQLPKPPTPDHLRVVTEAVGMAQLPTSSN